jgi:hypothetical protein
MKRGPLMAVDDGLWDFAVTPLRESNGRFRRERTTSAYPSLPAFQQKLRRLQTNCFGSTQAGSQVLCVGT